MASRADIEAALKISDRQGDKESSDRLRVALFEMSGAPASSVEEYAIRLRAMRPEESGALGNLAKGFGAGVVGTIESAALGAATILDEEAELEAREKIQSIADRFTPEGGDRDSITYNLGSGLGSILGTGAATLAGGALAGPVGAITAGTAAGVGVQVGEASERAREAGISEEERNRAITNPMIIGAGLLETIPYLKAVGKFSAPTANKLSKMLGGDKELKGLLDRARSAGTTGGVEALQELAQNTAQNLVEQGYNPDRELTEGAAASAGYGGATGAIYQLLIDVLPGRQRGVTPKRDAPPRTEEDVQDVQEEISEEDIEREQAELFGEDGQGELFPQTTLDRRNAAARREDEAKLADDAETKEIEAMLAEDERAKKQIDIDEVIDKDKKDEAAAEKDAAETEEVEALLAEDAGVEAEATAEEALKELPATDRRVQEGREKRAAETRKRILDQVLNDSADIRGFANPERAIQARYHRALKAEGITKSFPTEAERATIASEVKKAKKLQQTSGDPLATGDTARGTTTTARPSARTEPARSRASVQDDTKDVGRESGVQKPAATTEPRTGRLERTSPSPVVPTVGTAAGESSLANAINKAKARFKGVPEAVELGTPVETTSPVSTNVPPPGPATTTTAPKRATTKPKVKAKPKVRAKAVAPTTPKPATGPMGAAAQMEKNRKTGYRDEVFDSQNPVTDADRQAVKASKNRNVATYLGAAPDPVAGILDAINDVVLETQTTKVAKDDSLDPDVRKLQKGRSKDAASDALKEAKKIMSPEVGKFIDKKLAEKQKELETKPPISKQQSDIDLAEQRKNRKRKIEDREAQEEVLNQAQFEKAKKELIKQTGRKTATKKQVVEYMRVTDRFKKFATLPPEPKKSREQKEVDEVVETLEEIEVYDAINDVAAAELGIDLNIDGLPYINKDIEALGIDLSPEITALLRAGNLKEALEKIMALPKVTPRVRQTAKELVDNIGDTKVFVADGRVRNNLYKAFKARQKADVERYGEGAKTLGLFVNTDSFGGIDNTIILDPEGLTVHTLLHEMTHAATYETIINKKGSPAVKQLEALYKEVKEKLPTAYGSESLLEFVAEAFSNPSFQRDLSKIYTKKDLTLSAWQRFANAVKRILDSILGRSTSAIYRGKLSDSENALNTTDALILQILQPAKNFGSGVTLAHMSTKEGVQKVMGNLGKIGKKFKPMTKADGSRFGDSAIDFITGSPRKFGEQLLELAPMLAVVDIAKSANAKLGKLAMDMHNAMLKQRAAIRESDNELSVIKGEFAKWADKQSEEMITRFNNVVYSTTTTGIDVAEKKITDYKEDATVEYKGQERLSRDVYAELKKEWDALGPDGQKVYNDMRQTYRNQFEKLKRAIFGDIDAASTDKESTKKVKDLLTKRLFDKTELAVYFPLLREGEFKLVYELKADRESDRDQAQVEMFKTNAAMQRRIKELEADPEVEQDKMFTSQTGKTAEMRKGIPATSFVNEILTQLDIAGVDKEVSSNILELYIDSLPESAFAKTIRKRQNIQGYIPDAMYTFNRKSFDIGRQIARLTNTSALSNIQREINEYAKIELDAMQEQGRDEKRATFESIVNQLNLRGNYARNPKTQYQALAQGANRFAFMYTIGFNASSAIVNMSQIPLFVMPYLGAQYGYGNAGAAIKDAGSIITASSGSMTASGKKLGKSLKRTVQRKGDVTEDIEFEGKASLENYFIARYDESTGNHVYELRDDVEYPSDEVKQMVESMQPLVQAAADTNQLDQSIIGSEINVDQSGQERGFTDSATRLGAWGFHNVENYNRQVTLAATYLLGLRKLEADKGRTASKEEKQKLALDAVVKAQELNGGSVKETGSRLGQTDLGSVALMYKNYGVQMYYNMFKSAAIALKSADPEQRNIAIKQLAGVHLTSLFFAGVQGIPLYGAVKLIANMFLDDEEEDWDSMVRRNIGEGWYKGAVTKYSGADVSKRVSLGQLLFQTNRYNPEASPEEELFFYLGGPAWSTSMGVYRGFKDLSRGNIERGIEGLVPTAFRNAWRGLGRYNREGALTRRGDPIYDDFSAGELAGQVLGFAPRDYAFNQEQNMMSKGIERSIAKNRSDLLRKYYVARRNRDWPRAKEVKEDIKAFNKRHGKQYGKKVYISADTIDRSMKRHMEQSYRMHNGVSLNPMLEKGLKMQREQWDQGWELF